MTAPFIPHPAWQLVRQLGSVPVHKGADLRVMHVRHTGHESEAVELRMILRNRDGDRREEFMRIDTSAIPALIKMLERV